MPDSPDFRVRAPYRFNPLGAHVDHQGGDVLARTFDRCTELVARPLAEPRLRLVTMLSGETRRLDAPIRRASSACAGGQGGLTPEHWQRYALGAAQVLAGRHALTRGLDGRVRGSMVAAGLSSSASFLLAVLAGLARCNGLALSNEELVDCVRQVEHRHLGLSNGLQDQLSIVHGRAGAIARLRMSDAGAEHIDDPPAAAGARWLLCFSGVSRELIGSGFNTRVAECREAAERLQPGTRRLGDVPRGRRSLQALQAHSPRLARRARHVYTEMARVETGAAAWREGDLATFGALMNASCASSIEDYESGSDDLIDLQRIALATQGVFGSRFSGGGYGGCLVMLVRAEQAGPIGARVLHDYLERHPDRRGMAECFVAGDAAGVQVHDIDGSAQVVDG